MRIRLVAVGRRMPPWVDEGVREYTRRLRQGCTLEVVPVDAVTRHKNTDPARAMAEEGRRLLRAAGDAHRVALDGRGHPWRTEDLAARLEHWSQNGGEVALLVGGADGLWPPLRAQADEAWSLSPLTLPHALVRILVAEQIYRAWSLLRGHPYHR